ncbi:MAG TPA: hypothetical protein VEW68_01435 [Patescibacteria group bacterium]|nr:hypothetical protein [Patescibacteria group bacterium]
MRRVILTVGMLLMGMALVGGAVSTLVGPSLSSLDEQVGTHASAAGAVLGIGLIAASLNPAANIGWVRAGAVYGFVVLAFEAGSYFLWHTSFHIGPVFFGLAFSLLLIAAYPQKRRLAPPAAGAGRVAPPPAEPSGAAHPDAGGEAAKESG